MFFHTQVLQFAAAPDRRFYGTDATSPMVAKIEGTAKDLFS